MAASPSDRFSKALTKFRDDLTEVQKQQFSSSNHGEVERAIKEIQAQLGSRKKLRNFDRVKIFLEGMAQVEELVTIFLNVNDVVAFVWGPIKLALMAAKARIDMLEHLLETYVEIGDVIHGLGQYDRLFRNHAAVREILERYFDDVLRFHKCVLDVFAKPDLKRLFSYVWPSFETRFRPIIDSLKRHRALLSDEKLTAVIEEIQASRDYTGTRHGELSKMVRNGLDDLRATINKNAAELRDSLINQISSIVDKLNPPDYEADQRWASGRRHSASSGAWVLEEPSFIRWNQGGIPPSNTLFLHGIPGSGKTTLLSRIIEHLKDQRTETETTVVFFYFKHNQDTKRSMSSALRALLVQLLDQDDASLEYLHQKLATLSGSDVTKLDLLQELVKDCLLSQDSVRIVLDGLDECADEPKADNKEARRIIEWFHNSVMPEALPGRVRLLIAGQRDGQLEDFLSPHPNIRLDGTKDHLADIRSYSVSRAADIRGKFSLSSSEETEIVERVTDASKGMFLYATVVLDNLLSQESPAEFEEEMENKNFPMGLDAAYNRVVARVFDRAPEPRQRSAAKILGWLVCAARPLRWREIQSKFCIDAEKESCNFKNRRVSSCKVICGSLIEVEQCELFVHSASEQVIKLVHDTAGKYLVHHGRLRLAEEHMNMAVFCCRYLASSPFTANLEPGAVHDLALSGYYGLQDYATAFWRFHVRAIIVNNSGILTDHRLDVLRSIVSLLIKYGISRTVEPRAPDLTSHSPALIEDDVQALLEPRSDHESRCLKVFEQRTLAIRKVLEAISLSSLGDTAKAAVMGLLGEPRFKCPKIECTKFTLGFLDRKARDAHVDDHERPFKCLSDGCYAGACGFSSQSSLDAHVKRFHADRNPEILFPAVQRKKDMESRDIFTACERGNLEEVKTFHRAGVDLNTSKRMGYLTPLVIAARHGHAHICAFLVEHGARAFKLSVSEHSTQRSLSALNEAIKTQDHEIFHFLWHSADKTARDAFISGHEDMNDIFARAIVDVVGTPSHDLPDEFLQCVQVSGFDKVLPIILRNACYWGFSNVRVEALNTTPLHRLFGRLFPDLYESDGTTFIHRFRLQDQNGAKEKWHSLLLDMEVASPEELSGRERQPLLHCALGQGALPIAAFLLDVLLPYGSRITDCNGNTPLHLIWNSLIAFEDQMRYIARRLIEADKGVAANVKNSRGELPVHRMASWARSTGKEVFDLLVKYTSNLDDETNDGETVLDIAARRGESHVVRWLLETNRVTLLRWNKKGRTPFTLAAASRPGVETMALLRSANQPLVCMPDGTADRLTPLHYAMDDPFVNMITANVKYLLSLPEAKELVWAFSRSTVSDNPQRLGQLFEFALAHEFDDVAKTVLRTEKADLSALNEETLQAVQRLWQEDPESMHLLQRAVAYDWEEEVK